MGIAGVGRTYHSIVRFSLHQRAIKHLPEIGLVPLRDPAKIIHERSIKQTEFTLHLLEVLQHVGQTRLPELAHHKPTLPHRLIKVPDKLEQELLTEMLDRIKPKPLQLQLRPHPLAPPLHILPYLRVREIDVGKHQVIVVCVFRVDVLGPLLVVADDLVDGFFLICGVIVRPREVIPVVFLRGVFVVARGEVEAEPAFDFLRVGDGFEAVWRRVLG
jgi:hypothetical protein